MHPSLVVVLVGALFLASFTGLAALRRQRFSIRFVVEGAVLTAAGAGLCLLGIPVNAILFLVVLYLVTLRVRLLVDAANALTNRGRFRAALGLVDFALRLGPDWASRQVALVNRGVTQLRMGEPEAAYFTIKGIMLEEELSLAARHQAAGFYNLGVACLRTKRPTEAERYFRKTMEIMPGSLYATAAEKALKRAAETGSVRPATPGTGA